jgi:very-short-patch-repair endonuclease
MAKGTAGNKVRTITCVGCGETVTRRMRMPPVRRYCSRACYRTAPKPTRRTGAENTCERCGTAFYVHAYRLTKGGRRFCSIACHNENQGRNTTSHTCKTCCRELRWPPTRSASGEQTITYCSLECRDVDPERAAMLREMNKRLQLRRMTRAENAGYEIHEGIGVPYVRQPNFAGKFTLDAAIPSARLAVQFDGDYWHDRAGISTEPRVLRRGALDRSQDGYVRVCGWEVVRLWESDLRADPVGCAEKITRHLRRLPEDETSLDPTLLE